jgi:putative tricarboxylic transport membrane protein
MTERIFALLLMVLGILVLIIGLQFDMKFSNEPVGPRPFPVIAGSILASMALVNIIKGSRHRAYIYTPNLIYLILLVFLYCALFQLLGFMLSTTFAVYLIARLTSGSWMQSLLTGLLIAIIFYSLFHFLLDVPLPFGKIYSFGV